MTEEQVGQAVALKKVKERLATLLARTDTVKYVALDSHNGGFMFRVYYDKRGEATIYGDMPISESGKTLLAFAAATYTGGVREVLRKELADATAKLDAM